MADTAMRYRGQNETVVSSDAQSGEKTYTDEKHINTEINEELSGFEQALES